MKELGSKFVRTDRTSKKYNRLTVLRLHGRNKHGHPLWECKCDCGTTTIVSGCSFNKTKSCGCLLAERRHFSTVTHGYARKGKKSPEYTTWVAIRQRCSNPSVQYYCNYGGRGIKVCERWINSFENFLADMGNRPTKNHSIERINNDGNYEPSNCKWGTPKEQSNNNRNTCLITRNGITKSIAQWAEEFGVIYSTFYSRVKSGKF